MAKFQVVNVTPRAGTGKGGKPYSMLIVDGVLTDDKNNRSTAEHVCFADKDGVLPKFEPGAIYEPVMTCYANREKKLSAGIFELRPVKS